jgi:hypothetical protein
MQSAIGTVCVEPYWDDVLEQHEENPQRTRARRAGARLARSAADQGRHGCLSGEEGEGAGGLRWLLPDAGVTRPQSCRVAPVDREYATGRPGRGRRRRCFPAGACGGREDIFRRRAPDRGSDPVAGARPGRL